MKRGPKASTFKFAKRTTERKCQVRRSELTKVLNFRVVRKERKRWSRPAIRAESFVCWQITIPIGQRRDLIKAS